ncbi:MAG: ketopantoate reductase family protein [Lentisphaeria bacterium]|nr:ketopantoate reductase family protein [Lentisphaeria bacterium]
MRILLIAPGAIGAYFGGKLALAGASVAIAGRNCDDLCRDGFEIRSIAGDFQWRPAQWEGAADWILIAGKFLPDADYRPYAVPYIDAHTRVLLIQNGIGVEDLWLERFPDTPLYSAVAYIGASRTARNRVEHTGSGYLIFGRHCGAPEPEAAELAELWHSAGIRADLTGEIQSYRWKKLLWNVPYNVVSVLSRSDTRRMMDGGSLEAVCLAMMEETAAVAAACGFPQAPEILQETAAYTRDFPAYKTSMLLDFEAARPMEIEGILGNVVRLAQHHQVPVPHLSMAYALLTALSEKNGKIAGKI